MNTIDKKYFLMAVSGSETKEISPTDIAVKCPVCGDSKMHRNEKRLHIYEKNHDTRVGCFNGDCPVGQRNVYSFLRDFYPELFTMYKREKFQENLNSFKTFRTNGSTEPVDVFANIKKVKNVKNIETSKSPKRDYPKIVTQDLSKYFEPVENSSKAMEYIKSRGYSYNENDFGKWYHANVDLTIGAREYHLQDFLVIPLYIQGKMYGFYSRSLNDKKFYTYMNDFNVGYKVWNYFNVDLEKPCYITEGIFDAIALWEAGFKNVMACMGANLPDDILRTLKEPVFCLDNDKTGKLNNLKYTQKGLRVLVYPDDLVQKDLNEMFVAKVDIKDLVQTNVFKGIMAEIKLRSKL